jgi:hypothetical protein
MAENMKYIKYLFLLILCCCSSSQKYFLHAKVDLNFEVSPNAQIFYTDICVGKIDKITIDINRRERVIRFYLYKNYLQLVKNGSKLIFKNKTIFFYPGNSEYFLAEESFLKQKFGDP